MSVLALRHTDWDELQIAITHPQSTTESAHATLMRAVSAAHRSGAELIHANVFAQTSPDGSPLAAPRGVPVSFVEGAPVSVGSENALSGAPLVAGLQAVAARNAVITHYDAEGGAAVTVVEDRHARWAYVTGVVPARLWAPPGEQAYNAYERAEAALALAGMSFAHVVRTWVFVEDILGWYGDLNRARTTFYRERGVFDGTVPASTGVGACNPAGAAVLLDVIALDPKSSDIVVERVASPLQCSAEDYGSSFSRALEIREPGLRRLLVSGTASIGPDGATRHVDDLDRQIELTFDVVEAILRSRDMDWTDVSRATAYFRHGSDAPALGSHLRHRSMQGIPWVVTECTICRDDLLFEIEVDACVQE